LGDEVGVELYAPHVALAVVVPVEGVVDVLGAVVGGQVAGRPHDRVAVVVHVAAVAVRRPGGGHELHGPLGAGHRGAPDATGGRLDQVDGGQVPPRDPEGGLGGLVVGQQLVGRCGRDDLPGRDGGGERAVHGPELAAGRHVDLGRSPEVLG